MQYMLKVEKYFKWKIAPFSWAASHCESHLDFFLFTLFVPGCTLLPLACSDEPFCSCWFGRAEVEWKAYSGVSIYLMG